MAAAAQCAVRIPTDSMAPTFSKGDVLVGRFTDECARWDVVGFRHYLKEEEFARIVASRGADAKKVNYEELKKALGTPSAYFVGRVAGLEGEEIHFQHDGLYVNGDRMRPPANLAKGLYTTFENPSAFRFGAQRFKVPFGRVFVMKDNHSKGTDSRHFGPVRRSNILARVVTTAKLEDLSEEQRKEIENFHQLD